MRNIIQIFLRDIRKIKGNTIAMIIMVGILVVPTLYAWFNIGGSWDPYENTSDIKIAVASDDAGTRENFCRWISIWAIGC